MAYEGGYTGAVNDASVRDDRSSVMALRALQARQLLQQLAEHQQQQQDRAAGGGVLESLVAGMRGGGAPQMAPPPVARGPNPMAPGGASVMAPPAAMQQGAIAPPPAGSPDGGPMPPGVGVSSQPSAPIAPPPIPPFRPLPSAVPAMNDQGGLNPIAPPPGESPAEPAAAPAPAAKPEPKGINIQSLVEGFKAAGIPKERWMAQLEQFTPLMNASNKQELAAAQIQLRLTHDVAEFAHKRVLELQKDNELLIRAKDVESKVDRRAVASEEQIRANDIKERKISAAAAAAVGGSENLKRTEFERDANGNIIGATGITKTGKIVRLNADGTLRDPGQAPANPRAPVNQGRDLRGYLAERNSLVNEANPTKNGARIAELDKLIKDAQAAPKPKVPAPGGDPKKVSSKAEFDAIPKGATFIDARDGQTKIKG